MLKVRKPSNGNGAIADGDAPILSPDSSVDHGLDETVVVEAEEPAAADRGGDSEYAELGEHVASVLSAANQAAAKIRCEAETDAERIADATRSEAMATLSNANREADRLLGEADQRRVEADEAARATRQAADAYGEQQRRDARADAARIVAEADQEAARRADATAERYQTLQDHVSRTEERLEQLVAGLRELASRLDDVLHPPAPGDDPAPADPAVSATPSSHAGARGA